MADAQGNQYGPYDIEVLGSEAEAFTEDAWYLMNRQSGVISGGGLTFTGLTAHLAPVELRSHGSFLARDAEWTDASPATTGATPRRDLLVARRQRTSGEGAGATAGKTFLTVLRGTPAATPVDPDHDPDDDEPLWSWQVPGSGGTVVTGVLDLRCTLLSGGIKSFASAPARDRHFPAPTKGQLVAVDGIDHVYNGSRWIFSRGGYINSSTDASGVLTVFHDLGVLPSDVQVTKGSYPAAGISDARVNALSTTQAQLVFTRTDNSNALGGNPVTAYWKATS